jgi:molybdopterin molybdotransferase
MPEPGGFLITVEDAFQIMQTRMPDWGYSTISIAEAARGIIADDILADRDYPPYDRSTMDGIAVSWKSFQEGLREFHITGICAAGEPQTQLTDPRSCFEIMTGAPVPRNADLVIPYEDLIIENNTARVKTQTERAQGENIHVKGSDSKKNSLLLKAGSFLNGPAWGVAASVGANTVKVKKQPRIQIISTGNELVSVEQTPLEHQIRRSNSHALQASLQLHGYTDITLTHLNDDHEAVKKHYAENKNNFDLLIYSGAVSKGKFDYLPQVWKQAGVTEHFHGVSQRPGKPLWFGVDDNANTAVLGLPGNPVSSLVCLHRYFLKTKEIYVELTEEFIFKKDLTYFLPVKIEFSKTGVLKAHPLKIKNSGEFTALAESDGFLELPKEKSVFAKGEAFRYFSWSPV